MGVDQGTTGTTVLLLDEDWNLAASSHKEHKQYYPQPGWVEHDPKEILAQIKEAAEEVMEKAHVTAEQVECMGIDNQGETVVVWDKVTGEPLYPAIVWQDRRTATWIEELEEDIRYMIRQKTGLHADAYFGATKIKWILDNVEGAKEAAMEGRLLAGPTDSWFIWNLTDRKVFATDYSTASRTALFNIHTNEWDHELLELLEIPKRILPEIRNSTEKYGYATLRGCDGKEGKILISGNMVDQQAALFGQACLSEGMVKTTYGTGCFMLMNTGEKPIFSKNGLVTTIAWGLDGKVNYALEGSIFVAGAAIQWLRDELRIIDSAPDSEYMAKKVKDTNGCYVVPAFTGLGAPHWDQYARGTIVGITRGVNKYHIIRATLESLAYQVNDVLEAMKADSGIELAALKVDGGASANDFLMQTQADIINAPVNRPQCVETTAMGAAYLAGLAVGYWSSKEDVIKNWAIDKTFEPKIEAAEREKRIKGWNKAVKYAYGWAKED